MRHGEWDLWEEGVSAPSASSSLPAEVDPLDELAKNNHCFISDLRLDPLLRREALRQLMECADSVYTIHQWQEAVNYLTETDLRFKSATEAKHYARHYLENQPRGRRS